MRRVVEDAGILLASLPPSEVPAALDECPADALKAHPFALLVLMRSRFNWRNIPKMLELKALLLAALEEHSLSCPRRSAATCWANATLS